MVEVTRMTEEHLDAVLAIENESFVFPWTRKSMMDELDRVNRGMAYYYVGLVDGEVAGYGGMWHVVTEGHVTNIAVKSEFRRMGVGDAIVSKMLETAEEKEMLGVTLEVRVSNEAALALYKKHGFTLEGLRKEYYEDNREDGYVMWKYLIPVENVL